MSIEPSKFSNKSKNLIKKVQQLTTTATQIIPQLYESLREDGIPPLEARAYIEEIVIISQRQLRRILPDEAKYIEKQNKPELTLKQDADIRPHTTTPMQPVTEVEIISEPQPQQRIKFNTDKFRRELRIALINGDTVWLTYNQANEVISIVEA